MVPDPRRLIERLGIEWPVIGFYDAPTTDGFDPVVEPAPGRHTCLFAFFKQWLQGKTLRLSQECYGCGGAGAALFSLQTRGREEFISFLADTEGLKCSHEVMARWLDNRRTYKPTHGNILIGPLKDGRDEYLKTVTFFVNPDQLSALVIGAHYCHDLTGQDPVLAPFGSGCMMLVTPFADLGEPQALIGATDIAMRPHIPEGLLAFTVTVPMYAMLCGLDERSFLYKPFLKNLQKARRRREARDDT
mgnify:FL=1